MTDLDILRRSKRVKNLITIDRVHGSKRRSTWVKNLTKKEVLPKMLGQKGLKEVKKGVKDLRELLMLWGNPNVKVLF